MTKTNLKILAFDCETSPYLSWVFQTGKQQVTHGQAEFGFFHETRIICISYAWCHDKKVRHLTWSKDHDEKAMLEKFVKIAAEADFLVAHNGPRFDVRTIRARIALNGLEDSLWPETHCIDTLADYRRAFRLPSYRLDAVAKMLGNEGKHSMGFQDWIDVCKNKRGALKKMVTYCDQDVLELIEIFERLDPYIPKTVKRLTLEQTDMSQNLHKAVCPNCGSRHVIKDGSASIKGERMQQFRCKTCNAKRVYKYFLGAV